MTRVQLFKALEDLNYWASGKADRDGERGISTETARSATGALLYVWCYGKLEDTAPGHSPDAHEHAVLERAWAAIGPHSTGPVSPSSASSAGSD